jgi:hypothetical protein
LTLNICLYIMGMKWMSCPSVYLMVLVVVVWSSTSIFGKFRSTKVEVKFEEVILYAHAVFRFCSVEVIITSFTVSLPGLASLEDGKEWLHAIHLV